MDVMIGSSAPRGIDPVIAENERGGRRTRRRGGPALWAVAGLALFGASACGDIGDPAEDELGTETQALSLPPKIDPNTIPKFVTELPRFATYVPDKIVTDSNKKIQRVEYTVHIAKFMEQQLPAGFPQTQLFGYGGNTFADPFINDPTASGFVMFRRTSPGPKFEQIKGIPALVKYRNELTGAHPLAVDPTVNWANPNNFPKPTPPFIAFPPGYPQAQSPIVHTTHTHGIEVDPSFDGTPDTWFTAGGILGPEYVSNNYFQPSSNQSAAFWYHDHAFGVTRLDVGFGLSGFSILRDPSNVLDLPFISPLPQGEFEVPLIIQDRSFRTDGSVFYPTSGEQDELGLAVPGIHPYWVLNQDGDTILVNGVTWPNMNVKRHQYRFRILNSASQRFFHFFFSNGMSFQVIGTDGGYLEHPRTITSWTHGVTERVDLLVDFSQFPVGTQIILRNDERRFPPAGPPADPNNDGVVMRFTVVDSPVTPPRQLPPQLNTIATLTPNRPTRILIQNVQPTPDGHIEQAELDGQAFHSLTTELPTNGSTEDWTFVNTTPLDHNKHVHLIQFLLVNRQNFNAPKYLADWKAVNGNPPFTHPTLKLPIEPYLMGNPEPPFPEESGWKDTIHTPAGQVTRIRVRWAPQQLPTGAGTPGVNDFPINPVYGIGFVWHCHLIEHEDNEMLRPMTVIPTWQSGATYGVENRNNPGRGAGLVDYQGVDYGARVAITNSTQPPPQRFDLWERINNQNGDWAVQTIYNVGDRVFFQGNVYRALRRHQATNGTQPNVTPSTWALVGPIPT